MPRHYFKCVECGEERRVNEKSKEGEWFERLRRNRKLEARGKEVQRKEPLKKLNKHDEKMASWLERMSKTSL